MRVKKTNVVVALGLGATALFMVYLVIDTVNLQHVESDLEKVRNNYAVIMECGFIEWKEIPSLCYVCS